MMKIFSMTDIDFVTIEIDIQKNLKANLQDIRLLIKNHTKTQEVKAMKQ